MPGSILGIGNYLALAIDVAIQYNYIATYQQLRHACWDPDHLCFGISGPGGPIIKMVPPDHLWPDHLCGDRPMIMSRSDPNGFTHEQTAICFL